MKIEVKHEKCGSELHQTFFEDGKKKFGETRKTYWKFPTLDIARDEFQAAMGAPSVIWDHE